MLYILAHLKNPSSNEVIEEDEVIEIEVKPATKISVKPATKTIKVVKPKKKLIVVEDDA